MEEVNYPAVCGILEWGVQWTLIMLVQAVVRDPELLDQSGNVEYAINSLRSALFSASRFDKSVLDKYLEIENMIYN